MKKPKLKKEPRRVSVPFEKLSHLLPAVVEGKFLGVPETYVWSFRIRGGMKPSWSKCRVVKVSEGMVELWDETLAQWHCFNPQKDQVDVRFSA